MIYRVIMRQLDTVDELEAENLSDCPALVRAYILNNDVSSSNWIAGEVYLGDTLIERLAFNGRKMA